MGRNSEQQRRRQRLGDSDDNNDHCGGGIDINKILQAPTIDKPTKLRASKRINTKEPRHEKEVGAVAIKESSREKKEPEGKVVVLSRGKPGVGKKKRSGCCYQRTLT